MSYISEFCVIVSCKSGLIFPFQEDMQQPGSSQLMSQLTATMMSQMTEEVVDNLLNFLSYAQFSIRHHKGGLLNIYDKLINFLSGITRQPTCSEPGTTAIFRVCHVQPSPGKTWSATYNSNKSWEGSCTIVRRKSSWRLDLFTVAATSWHT